MSDKRPNIIFIMADDHPSNAISCYDSYLSEKVKTPNIDRIAEEGMRLDSCFCVNSICTPSRASILSGQYGHKNGVKILFDDWADHSVNVAKMLQNNGYETAMIGKWHLRTEPVGFDYYNVLPGQGDYIDPKFKEKGDPWEYHNDGGKVVEGYVTDLITDMTIDWIENRENDDEPFFLMSHHKAPHWPQTPAKKYEGMFDDVELPVPPTLYEENDKNHGSPATNPYVATLSNGVVDRGYNVVKGKEGAPYRVDSNEELKEKFQKVAKKILTCSASLDESVGRILDYLEETGLAENTMVIYTSDQGRFLGEHNLVDKRLMYEESLRMPFVIKYPKEIEAGSVNDDIITNIDFAPTFLDFAGVPIPDEMQGRSFKSILQGDTPKDWRDSMYYRYWMHLHQLGMPAHYGIRTNKYKLIFFYGIGLADDAKFLEYSKYRTQPGWELYDIENDPYETNNIYPEMKDTKVVKDLKDRLLELKEKYEDTDEEYPELMEVRKEYW